MQIKPNFSVILPNYNHAKYINLAINQIIEQENFLYELIIIDDCSTDKSYEIIKKKALLHKKVKVFKNKKNLGTIKTQNLGIKKAKGEYLYFAAADDFIIPNFFKNCLKMFKIYPDCGLVCGDAILINEQNDFLDIRPRLVPSLKVKSFTPEMSKLMFLKIDNFVLTGSALIKKKIVKKFNNLDQSLESFSDGFMTREIAMSHGFVYVPQMVSVWRYYKTSFSKSIALDITKFNKINDKYISKISSNGNFHSQYKKIAYDRLNFQQQLTHYNFMKSGNSLIKQFGKFKLFLRYKPITFYNLFYFSFFYFIKKYLYKKKYLSYLKNFN